MLTILTLILSHVAALGAGVFFSPKIEAWFASWTAAKALKDAQSIIAKVEADAKALEAARKVVAAAPKTAAPTAAAGPTGA